MRVSLSLACFLSLMMSSLKADNCHEFEDQVVSIFAANEIFARSCNARFKDKDTTFWHKNDSKTRVSLEVDSRIHQFEDKLWFVPGKVEDSGHYYCIERNSTHCLKQKITVKFVKNEPNLCYNSEALFPQRLFIGQNGLLACPALDLFKDENNEVPSIQWYKDCKPLFLDNTRYIGVGAKLFIMNVTKEDKGKYSCLTSYAYLGKQYRISRVIDLTPAEKTAIQDLQPVIMKPANETLEVEPGSYTQLICNVTGLANTYWSWNGSDIDDNDTELVEDFIIVKNHHTNSQIAIVTLNISQVESKFYLHPFVCKSINWYGKSAAYIQLIHPVRDFQNYIIGIFSILTVVIMCSIFIYKIFKVDIVLWYRDCRYEFFPGEASDGKIYDAYILYPKTIGEESASDSDIFVFKILPEVLEKQCGYTLFIYGRDDYVGEDIVEVMDENIKKSRRLIIILVRDTLGFSCLGDTSEEQIAMYNALVHNGLKVILLELEKIQDYEKMSESIKFLKQKQKVIRWPGDFTEKSQSAKTRFWKNVRFYMPAPRKAPSSSHLMSRALSRNSTESCEKGVHVPLG
ncbi:interleukin-1 receptor type 1 [Tenrec ecaudatus]|uniref:interleukin-1 receptor type 1 n=1 Tax=Tenrec ecaudatus TaxID=94439 RepID=UPI003F591CC4